MGTIQPLFKLDVFWGQSSLQPTSCERKKHTEHLMQGSSWLGGTFTIHSNYSIVLFSQQTTSSFFTAQVGNYHAVGTFIILLNPPADFGFDSWKHLFGFTRYRHNDQLGHRWYGKFRKFWCECSTMAGNHLWCQCIQKSLGVQQKVGYSPGNEQTYGLIIG